jgi:hypothetical protein
MQIAQCWNRNERCLSVDERAAEGRIEHPSWYDALHVVRKTHQPQSLAKASNDVDRAVEIRMVPILDG